MKKVLGALFFLALVIPVSWALAEHMSPETKSHPSRVATKATSPGFQLAQSAPTPPSSGCEGGMWVMKTDSSGNVRWICVKRPIKRTPPRGDND